MKLLIFISTVLWFFSTTGNYAGIVWNGTSSLPRVALTFDDGPKPEESPKILEILDRFGVRATFFVVGREAQWHPDLIYRMYSVGHEIANHSYSHCRLDSLTETQIKLEITATNELIQKITGEAPRYIRPPGGRYNRLVLEAASALNLQIIMFDVNAGDYTHASPLFEIKGESKDQNGTPSYSRSKDDIIERVVQSTRNGSIILFHNGGTETIQALPEIILSLRKKGVEMVTISELLAPESSVGIFRHPIPRVSTPALE